MSTLAKWGEVDYLVVGNSPAGSWLLAQLPHWLGAPARLGRLESESRSKPIWINSVVSQLFDLKAVQKKNLEFLWPADGMRWNIESLAERYPKVPQDVLFASDGPLALSPKLWASRGLDAKTKKFFGTVLSTYPDLLGAAQSLWRVFGKTDSVSTEMLLWNLFACLNLFQWSPEAEIPDGVERFGCLDIGVQFTGMRSNSDGSWEIDIQEKGAVVAKHVIFALSAPEIKKLRPLLSSLSIDVNPKIASKGDFKLSIDLAKGTLPAPMCDLCFVLDSWEIPEPETEVWPLERSSDAVGDSVEAWVTSHSDPSLDSISHGFQKAVKRLQDLIPFASQNTKSYRPGLHWEECRDDESRAKAVSDVEATLHERFSLSLMESRTRHKNLFLVGPYFFTQWPYPMGELWSAQSLQSYLVAPKSKKEKRKETTSLPPTP